MNTGLKSQTRPGSHRTRLIIATLLSSACLLVSGCIDDPETRGTNESGMGGNAGAGGVHEDGDQGGAVGGAFGGDACLPGNLADSGGIPQGRSCGNGGYGRDVGNGLGPRCEGYDIEQCAQIGCFWHTDAEACRADRPAQRCDCAEGEICVQFYDGTCQGGGVRCVAATEDCPQAICNDACGRDICGDGENPDTNAGSCDPLNSCGGEVEGALPCYGI